ncbi:MAG: hypothetical protein A3A44_00910 [Candidatus Sungbacteria bacterium RIFCSPLOWO2_01_FULL_60_25]|uniref:VOC domain-containing protein n=1 Tax=Candidatus Sungbacteria bacterium RIFCSPLOWO2_01_FULL_60_25 TaxID=1802281 RepID=A0A1G2L9Y4_9BACT|nr:MAG: hypothetical protein A3A44_00910 [Candidatus Sungbacteria bacterium RIFCSPLOWO2_01_FULL_60_25]
MNSYISHIQVNIDPASRPFYRELFTLLGWKVLHEDADVAGYGGGEKGSVWFVSVPGKSATDYDERGVNHVGIGVGRAEDVDAVAGFLREKGVAALFGTPRHRPEFSGGEGQTYYQVMFETPDKALVEVVYTGPRAR